MNVDKSLIEETWILTESKEKAVLRRQSLPSLIEQESSQELASLGGSEPELRDIPRRRDRRFDGTGMH